MDARQERGLAIAARCRVVRQGMGWSVPSQSSATKYTVTGLPTATSVEAARCTCPDYETRGVKCKHIFAVEYVIQRETNDDGSTTVTETVRVTKTVRRTYPQNWPAYNAAQTNEGDHFQALLRDLCATLPEPEQKRGRPRATVADSVFCAAFKVYSTISTRRFMSDLRAAQGRGYIAKVPHQSSVFRYLEDPALTPILRDLITRSSLPLKAVEVDFAVDSTGFTTSRFTPWFEHKYGAPRQRHDWVKAHVMCGVKTNVVTAIEIKGRDVNDSTQLPALVDATVQHFPIGDVSADKAYGTVRNADTITGHGGTPFIAFKSVHTGKGGHRRPQGTGAWGKMFGYFLYRRDEFMAHYHQRSNVETTFSMIKRKFGDSVRSKTDTAMVNEVLCKVLCHNLVVLIHEMYELGIAPVFEAGSAPASELAS
jgi:transposase/predicted nucleic acid-binding Zn finger protein